ncbi:hypothetical protein [Acetobacter aceti]|uniref:hypothetical protein n=1 Tax=Acetobacter aceti TaxID=435 RepID=UPI001656F064|nr:hypothetical protein [Acetobacter aceti]
MKEAFIAAAIAIGISLGCARYRYEIAQTWLAYEMWRIRTRLNRARRFERYLSSKLERK